MFENLCKKVKRKELSNKINEFYRWTKDNLNYSDFYIEELKNFVESMAVWYEFCFPYVVIRNDDEEYINDEIFNQNNYINENFDENSDVRLLEWNKLFNLKVFNYLARSHGYLNKPKYPHYINIRFNTTDVCNFVYHFEITNNGRLRYRDETNFKVGNFECNDITLKEFRDTVPYQLSDATKEEIDEAISDYENRCLFKEKLLDAVMYRIIERGGVRIGPRRGFKFALEFDRNIDIPMIYGIDSTDPYLKDFINSYLHEGGSIDLECYSDYFRQDYSKITIKEQLKYEHRYTDEEHELHQRLVNAIASNINEEELKEHEVTRKRIERKLNKSKGE